jgi:putative hydrolase of the HAD superfamily
MAERYDAVLLDLYDTIVWSEWSRLRDLIAERSGLDAELLLKAFDASRRARGIGTYPDAEGDMRSVLEAAGLEADPTLVDDLVRLELDELTRGVHLYDDALPVVRSLRQRGVRTALVSNCSHSTRPVVERLGLDDEFDAVVLSFEARVMKPDPGIYRTALDRLGGVEPSRAVFVDDQRDYCDGAAELGIDTRLIERPDPISFESVLGMDVDAGDHPVVADLGWLR